MDNKQKRLVNKWLRALSTGRYRRANGALVEHCRGKHRKYCAIGVLAKEANLDISRLDHALPNKEFRKLTGLSATIQSKVINKNDTGEGWGGIVAYVKKQVEKTNARH